jgi:hypothetical protein
MKQKISIGLAAACLLVGCSKREEPAAPLSSPNAMPTTNATTPVVPVTPAPEASSPAVAPAAEKSALETLGGIAKPAAEKSPSNTVGGTVTNAAASTLALADLPSDQLTRGLKEALAKGLQQAIAQLGQEGGFLTNLNVKIPMPEKLQALDKTLRQLGQGRVADEFITTMNHAAEQAVPVASSVFAETLKQMTVADARGILSGPDDAATQYFRRMTEAQLTEKFLPIVKEATAKTGVTASYKQLTEKASLASPFLKTQSLDLDAYVNGKALDGLFKMVAAEEKRIRQNPVARTTDLLKSVFGALQK